MQDQRSGIEVNAMMGTTPEILPFGLLGSALLILAAPGPLKVLALMGLLGVG